MNRGNSQFLTIAKPARGIYKEKGSKFLSFAIPVENEDEVKTGLDDTRKKFHDARHHCYAWKIGEDLLKWSDDGEPNNTAGKPIFAQIESRELTNVLVIVVRYFGGTLLGVGGLIRAYKTAASDALQNAKFQTKYIYRHYLISYGYSDTNLVKDILRNFDTLILDQNFSSSCTLKLKIKKDEADRLESAFNAYEKIEIELMGEY